MRIFGHGVVVLLGMMWLLAGCEKLTSPQPSPRGEGVACRTLVGIDSLMWQQPDSALTVMMQFAASPEADSLNEFEGHYCQVLVAELLFKNDYEQSNRTEVLKAVGYFDSIVNVADGRNADTRDKADTRGVSVRERDAFWRHGHIILTVQDIMSMTASLRLAGNTFALCG